MDALTQEYSQSTHDRIGPHEREPTFKSGSREWNNGSGCESAFEAVYRSPEDDEAFCADG
jgi:hypothetical protein